MMAKCEMCLEADPVMHCKTCSSSKCVECDERYHKPVKRSDHKRTPIHTVDQNNQEVPANDVVTSSNGEVMPTPSQEPPSATVNATQPIDLSFIKQGVNPGTSVAVAPMSIVTGYTFGNNTQSFPVPSSASNFSGHPGANNTLNQIYAHHHHQGTGTTPGGTNAARFPNPASSPYMQGGSGTNLATPAFFESNFAPNNVVSQADPSRLPQSAGFTTSNVQSNYPFSSKLQYPTRPEIPPQMAPFTVNSEFSATNGSLPRFQGPNSMQMSQQTFRYQTPSYPINVSMHMPPNSQHPMGNQFPMGSGYPMGASFIPGGFGYPMPYMQPPFNSPYNCGPIATGFQQFPIPEKNHKKPEHPENGPSKEQIGETISRSKNEDVVESCVSEEVPKFCVKCGAGLSEDFNFCAKCGYRVERIKKPAPVSTNSETISTQVVDVEDPSSDESIRIPKLSIEKSDFEKSGDNDSKSQKTEDSCDSFYTPVPSPVNKTAEISFNNYETVEDATSEDKEEQKFVQNEFAIDSENQHFRTQYSSDGTENEDMLLHGLSTFTFIKSKLLDGQDLNDLELLLSSGMFSTDCNEDDIRAIIEEDLTTVNDVFGPMLEDKLRGGCDRMKSASETERQNALEATAFDSIKSSTLLANWREYLLECFFGNGLNADDFHDAMLQSQGDVRKAASELQIGLINENNQRYIWSTDENENALEETSRIDNFECLSAKTMTDTLLEKAIKSFCCLSPEEKKFPEKQMITRKVMAEKGLEYARAHLMISMLGSKDDIDYISAYLTAKNLTAHYVLVPKGYLDYFKECVTCCEKVVQDVIIKFPNCADACSVCVNCVRKHFDAQIYGSGRQVGNILCPGCNEKILTGTVNAMVLVQLKSVLSPELFSMFDTRALENCLESDKNFRWCPHGDCNAGFIWENNNVLKMQCFNGHLTCFKCGRIWKAQHDNATCEEFSQWELENDPAYQNRKLDGFLRAMDAMICPECNYRYELVRGGCLHFICSRCCTEFCGFCYARFSHGECRRFQRCQNMGFHSHCPRYCFSKTRDRTVAEIEDLLNEAGINYEKDRPQESDGSCPIVTRATDDAPEVPCGAMSPDGHAGLCETHYKEYLATLIRREKVDPVIEFSKNQCILELRNHEIEFNENMAVEELRELIRQTVPLEYA